MAVRWRLCMPMVKVMGLALRSAIFICSGNAVCSFIYIVGNTKHHKQLKSERHLAPAHPQKG